MTSQKTGIAGKDLFTVAQNSVATADIVTGKDPSPAVKRAASELARYLGKATGGKFSVRQKPGNLPFHFLVGPGALEYAGRSLSFKGLGDEGVIIRTIKNNMILTGGDLRGTLYSVYTFLENYVGCRWWYPRVEDIPVNADLTFEPINYRFIPKLEYRYTIWLGNEDADWAVRNRNNGQPGLEQPAYGGRLTHGGVHTFYTLIPPSKYFKKHPEWFSLIDGKREYEKGQLCLTNPGLFKELLKNLKATIRKATWQNVFSVSQNDWAGNCQCPECAKLDKREGSPIGSLLTFINAIADEVKKEFPDISISTLAYTYTRQAPKNIVPRDNVIIQLCSIECDFSVPLTHVRNKDFRRDIVEWSKISDRLYIWDYVANYSHFFFVFPNFRVMAANVRFFIRHNVKGLFEQGVYNEKLTDFAVLRGWVLAKLLWDPSLDDQKLIKEFCEAYYGPAARYVLGHINNMVDSILKTKEPLRCFSGPIKKYLSFETLNKSRQLMDKALKAVENDKILTNRVMLVRCAVLYSFIADWKELKAQAKKARKRWPWPADAATLAEEYKKPILANGIKRIDEWTLGFKRLEDAVARSEEP